MYGEQGLQLQLPERRSQLAYPMLELLLDCPDFGWNRAQVARKATRVAVELEQGLTGSTALE